MEAQSKKDQKKKKGKDHLSIGLQTSEQECRWMNKKSKRIGLTRKQTPKWKIFTKWRSYDREHRTPRVNQLKRKN